MRNAILLTVIFLAACSNYSANLPSIKPYKMDIQQGNAVTPKMMMQLRPGMTKAQVRFVMGTPLIADSFHANRWDYLYRMQKDGKIIEQRRIILDFEDDKLKTVRGDVIPAGSNAVADDKAANKAPITLKSASDPAPKPKEKGLLDKLQFWKDDEAAPAKPAEAAPEPKKTEIRPEASPAPARLPDIKETPEQPLPPLMDKAAAEAAPAAAKPAEKPVAAPAPKPAAQPEAAPATNAEEKGWLDKLKFWKGDDASAPAKPEPKPAPKADVQPAPKKAEPKAEPKPEAKVAPKPVPSAEAKPAPKPADTLPAEDDPSYFERMLEKIGF